MQPTSIHPVQRQYPVLYWTTLLYLVGIPNFIHFDPTGRTHTEGLFNPTSLANIALTLISGYLLAAVLLLERRSLLARRVSFAAPLWIALLFLFALSTVLQPASRLSPVLRTDLPLSLYRLGGWVLALLLLLALYTRSPVERALELAVQITGRVCWIWVGLVWLLLPVLPGQVYSSADESGHGASSLGGQLIAPSVLAAMATIAFFYCVLLLPPGLRRFAGCAVAALTVVMAHTRTELATFLMLLVLYALLLSRRPALRFAVLLLAVVGTLAAVAFRESLAAFLARGQSAGTLSTLDGRTLVWQAGLEAARERLWLGYGFLAGAKNALRDHWKYTYWIPPHTHNEFIQALLAGGLVAAVLILLLYGIAIAKSARIARQGPAQQLLLLLFVQLAFKGLFGPMLALQFSSLGGIFMLAFVAALDHAQRSTQSTSAPRPATARLRLARESRELETV